MQGFEKAVQQSSSQGTEFVYPTAPFAIEPSGPPSKLRALHGSWAWWQQTAFHEIQPDLQAGLDAVMSVLQQEGPFDGIVGFSQGAAMAVMVASLHEAGREAAFAQADCKFPFPAAVATIKHPAFKFIVAISGYTVSHVSYKAFYNPPIRTPTLLVIGSLDTVVEEDISLSLVDSCECADGSKPTIIWHSGGHTIPGSKRELAAIAHFITSQFANE